MRVFESQPTRRIVVSILLMALFSPALAAASVKRGEALYVGGTVAVPELSKGRLDTHDRDVFSFHSPQGSFAIPYKSITSLEYGQKAGRRVGVAIVISVWALFSKKRKHILTIGWKDDQGEPQGVVIEIPKGTAKSTITVLEVRSGLKVEYESEEARNHVHG